MTIALRVEENSPAASAIGPRPYLHQYDDTLGRLFDLSGDLLSVIGLDGYFKLINPSWERTLGWREVDILARPYLDFIHPDDREASIAEADGIGAGKTTMFFENRYLCSDGSYKWLEWTAVPSGDGVMFCSARDITEIKLGHQFAAAKAAIASLSVTNDGPRGVLEAVLRAICESMRWTLGQAWMVNPATDRLEFAASWSAEFSHAAIAGESWERGYAKGQGLPGMTWVRGATMVIADAATDERFMRRDAAARLGVHGAIALPVRVRGEIVGVLSFLSHEVALVHQDSDLVGTVDEIAYFVGALLDRIAVDQEIRHMAYHDTLTGLPNRALFLDRLDVALRQGARSRRSVVLMMADLDGFKQVNDELGHAAGDALLQCVAARIAGALRDSDTVARLGGDEFAIIADGEHDATGARVIAAKIREAVAQPIVIDGVAVTVGVSLGIGFSGSQAPTAPALLGRADALLYHAKRTRSGVVVDGDPFI